MDDFEEDTRVGYAYLGGYLTTDKRGIPRQRYHHGNLKPQIYAAPRSHGS